MAEKGPGKPLRIVFKEFKPGDVRKRQAKSNNTKSGGGARDLRLNHRGIGPIIAEMFPDREVVTRKRKKEVVKIEAYAGTLVYPVDPDQPSGELAKMSVLYELPTTARGFEGRIARINRIPSLARSPQSPDDRVFLLLVQSEGGEVRAHYVTETSLRSGRWHHLVSNTILGCIPVTQRRHAVQGFIDFTTDTTYCHARDKVTVRTRRKRTPPAP